MSSTSNGIFVAWRIFQRRTESLALKFNLDTKYYYCSWEETSKIHKAFSYIYKTLAQVRDLIRYHPKVVFIQLPPTPTLYLAAFYCMLTNSKLVCDSHNAMIYSKWLKWPFAKSLLRNADVLLVHNEDVEVFARQLNLNAITLRDPLPLLTSNDNPELLNRLNLTKNSYIIVPWSFSPDEPVDELIEAARQLPEVNFVMTWFAERLPNDIKNKLPANLILSGYLEDTEFCDLFAQAGAALVLTTREGTQPSASSEAVVLGIPLIVSDLNTTRRLYKKMPIYIKNTTDGIISGAKIALSNRDKYIQNAKAFEVEYGDSLNKEIQDIYAMLNLNISEQPT